VTNRKHVLEIDNVATCSRKPPRNSLFDRWLVHGTAALEAGRHARRVGPPAASYIILDHKPEVTLFMRYAELRSMCYVARREARHPLWPHRAGADTIQRVAAKAVEECCDFGSLPMSCWLASALLFCASTRAA